jgi:sorbose reductase
LSIRIQRSHYYCYQQLPVSSFSSTDEKATHTIVIPAMFSLARPTTRRATAFAARLSSQPSNARQTALLKRPFTSTPSLKNDPAASLKITDRLSLANKTIVVTGGGRGIGLAISKAIAQLGGNVAVLDSLPEPAEEFHSIASEHNVRTSYQRVDVSVQSSLETGFERVVEEAGEGGIQGCVTAAGITLERPFEEHTWEECQAMLSVNVLGTFWAAKLAASAMKSRGEGGSIVMIASIAAQGVVVPLQSLSMYNMSKAAVKGLVGPLAVELGEAGIRVNSISPGVIDSQMTRDNAVKFPRLTDMYHNSPPVRRIGQASDLTPLVALLLSEAGGFMTGGDYVVTGGLHAGVSPGWLERG